MSDRTHHPREGSSESRWPGILTTLAVIGLIVVMGLLIMQNRELKARVAELEAGGAGEPLPRLEPGDVVDGFTLASLDGGSATFTYDAPETDVLLLFFSPDCPACDANFPAWQAIDRNDDRSRRVVFVSTLPAERTREYLADKDLRGEVLLATREVLDRYKVSLIPTTVRVAASGVVRDVWVGVLPEPAAASLADGSHGKS